MSDGSISDVEFNLILREIENCYSLKGQLRMEVKKIENISSDQKGDIESLRQELKKKIQQKLGSLIDNTRLKIEFEKRERGFSLFISRDKFIS